ncbi:hypothetical protein NDU88_005254 [Pleurodeles waltl]|uniref:Uncharacterized protein n=1 Tax=Pleurodeles waltl TaxID=8319 RepID=A0AAV7VLH9_PLEWA|nr:hypothetical protein NDU88_005254 [Pleurodeles waltl]
MEQQGALMWYEDFQAGQSIDLSRGIVESEKGEVYGERSLEREEGPASVLQGLAGTFRSSRKLRVAQDTQGEEKAELWVAGWTYEGSRKSPGLGDGEVVRAPWDGRSGKPVDVSRHQQSAEKEAWWENGFSGAPRRP